MPTKFKQPDFMRALQREPVSRTPIWIMRQAGRHLPEFRAIREKHDFMTVCKTPELACEVAMQPFRRYDLDAGIVFSDILTIPDAMGLGLSFVKGHGPVFETPLKHPDQLSILPNIDVTESLHYVADAITATKSALSNHCPLIGFSGSPWTLASYMIEGQGSKTYTHLKRWLYQHPDQLKTLLSKLANLVTRYLQMQADAGADVLMLFDSWGGGILSVDQHGPFSLNWMQVTIDALKISHPNIPVILYARGCDATLVNIAKSGCNAIGIDHLVNIGEVKTRLAKHQVALQGNLDPTVLLTNAETVEQEAKRILTAYGKDPGHIFNLGVGILPETEPELVKHLVDFVHQ